MSPAAGRMPVVRDGLLLGTLREFRRDGPAFLAKLAREHGDVVNLRLWGHSAYVLSDPEIIRDVLVTHQFKFKKSRMMERVRILLGEGLLTSEGEYHKRQRRLVQPAFHRQRISGYSAAIVECSVRARESWKPGEPFDVGKEMIRLTLAIVGRTLFGKALESEADEIGAAFTEVVELSEMLLLPFSEYLEKLPLPPVRRFRKARERLDRTVYSMIAERRASGHDSGDLLSMLVLSKDEDPGAGNGMTDRQVRDEALTLLIAGHETTANVLMWAWYLLSQNPEAEARFHKEIAEVLGGRLPGLDDLPLLKYTEHVFAETLRLYPAAWVIGRKVLEDFQVGPWTVPAETWVLASPFVVQRDPRWFPEPLQFRPERWESDESHPKFAFFPFGGGARGCIGERLAWMEGVLALAAIGQKWRLRLAPGHRVETHARMTLRAKFGMRMIAEEAAIGF